jgi:thermitase
MEMLRTPIALAAAALCVPAALLPASAGAAEFAPGEVLVRFDQDVSKQEQASTARRAGGTIESRLPGVPRLAVVDLAAGASVAEGARRLEGLDSVAYAEPNWAYRVQAQPDDPFYPLQWGLDNTGQPPFMGAPGADISAEAAWELPAFLGDPPGSPDVTIAVIDTGLDAQHPDLAPNLWVNEAEATGVPGVDDDVPANGRIDDVNGWNFVDENPDISDVQTHGTHVAGIAGAAGDNAQGVSGVNWEVGLMGLRAGNFEGTLFSSDVIAAIDYADDMGADVINGSFTGSALSQGQRDAIAAAPDVLFVAAAGNGGEDGVGDDNDDVDAYPCNYELANLICVANTTSSDTLWTSSNYGHDYVDLGAPGRTIASTAPGDWSWTTLGHDGTFETSLAGWSTGGVNDTWARAEENPSGGLWSLTDSPGGPYSDDTDSFARTSQAVPLVAYSGCRVEADIDYDLAPGDSLTLEGSTTGADGGWSVLETFTGTGSAPGASYELDPFFFGASSFFLRFHLVTDATGTADGVHVDNVFVRCDGNYTLKTGTSMATPMVSGAAALLLDVDPGYNVGELRAALLGNVDPVAALECKTWTGGRLNLEAALVNGPPATPLSQDCPPPVVQPPPPPAPFNLKAAIKRCKKKFRKGTKGRKACIRKARKRAAA